MLKIFDESITRRDFLVKMGLLTAAVGLTSSPAFGAIGNTLSPERRLSLYNTHTGEKLEPYPS
jgi:hypothetical protein